MHQRLDKMMVMCILPNCTASLQQSLESEQVLYLLLFSKWGILWLWEEIPGSEQQIRKCDREWTRHTLISVDFPAPSGKCFFFFKSSTLMEKCMQSFHYILQSMMKRKKAVPRHLSTKGMCSAFLSSPKIRQTVA